MQTVGRKRSSGCNLVSAVSTLVKSKNKAWDIFTAGKNSEHKSIFFFHCSIPVAVGLNHTFPLMNVIFPFESIGLFLFS